MSPLRLLSALAALVVGLLLLGSQRAGSLDDVFVVLSQGRSLLEGSWGSLEAAGLPAWGATSSLDLLLKALLQTLGDPILMVWWGNTVLYLMTCWVFVRVARVLTEGGQGGAGADVRVPWMAGLLGLGFVCAPGFAEGSAYLLESALWGLCMGLVALGWLQNWRNQRLGMALVALAWCRPEAALLALLLAAIRPRLLPWVVLAVSLGFIWRYWAAGHILPDTFYAKSSDSRLEEVRDGIAYMRAFLVTPAGAGIMLGLCLAWLPGEAGLTRARRLSLLGGAALALVLLEGGDGYVGARLMLPVSLLGLGCVGLMLKGGNRVQSCGALVALALVLLPALAAAGGVARHLFNASSFEPLRTRDFDLEQSVGRGLACASRALGGATVGVRDMQSLRWFEPDVPLRDASGLTDRKIARSPAPGRVRHGRDAFGLLALDGVEILHLDHQRLRTQPWAGLDVRRSLTQASAIHIGFPRSVEDAELLARDYVAASLEVPGGWLNVLVLKGLAPGLRECGFHLEQPQ